jgi:hypothetical protein
VDITLALAAGAPGRMAVLRCVNGLRCILAETGKRSRSRAQITAAPDSTAALPFLRTSVSSAPMTAAMDATGKAAIMPLMKAEWVRVGGGVRGHALLHRRRADHGA